MNHMSEKNEKSKRGPKRKHTDQELMEIALQIKNKNKNQILTLSLLERETGIGRNTWSRNIKDFLDEINTPIARSLGLSDTDSVYFPNIETIFELYGNNQSRLKSELHKLVDLIQDIFKEREEYKQKAKGYQALKERIEQQEKINKELRGQLNYYRTEYEKIASSSLDPDLRKRDRINSKVINFQENKEKYTSLTNLQSLFPDIEMEEGDKSKMNMDSLAEMFPDLFK